MSTMISFLKLVEEEFFTEIQKKTHWGREEIKTTYINATIRVAAQLLVDDQKDCCLVKKNPDQAVL